MQVILVLGGSGGIGRAIVEALSGSPEQIVSASLDEPAPRQVDVSNEASVRALFEHVQSLGTLRAVINASGVVYFRNLLETPLSDWQRVLDVNLTGAFLCAREAARAMQGTGGRIVNLSSVSAVRPLPNNGAYAASKAGVTMLTAILNQEHAAKNIRATAIHLGAVDTGVWDSYPDFARSSMLRPESVGRVIAWLARLPLEVRIDEFPIGPAGGVL